MIEHRNIPIGGYFELELRKGQVLHSNAVALNSGRNALYYILKVQGYNRIYLPFYTCDVVLEPINKLGLEFDFYHIDKEFEPIFDFSKLRTKDAFLYVNYFGIKDDFIKKYLIIKKNLIIDNSQAYFSIPHSSVDSFYSPRKFLGLPDGGYAYTKGMSTSPKLRFDVSTTRVSHLILRLDLSPEEGFSEFQKNESLMSSLPLRRMSKFTERIISNVDHDEVARRRKSNFCYLKKHLNGYNKINPILSIGSVPMVYPFVCYEHNIQLLLAKHRIFCAKYWPNKIIPKVEKGIENTYINNLVGLPVDQRYSLYEMKIIVDTLKGVLSK